jgi:hypothetical protein
MLAGFACLFARLTRQDTLAIEVGSSEAVVFRFDEDCFFLSAVHQAGNRQPLAQVPVLTADPGARYEFATDGESRAPSHLSALRLNVRDSGLLVELVSPSGIWREDTLRTFLGYLLTLIRSASRSLSEIARSPTDFCVVARGDEHCATVRGAWQRLVPTGLELDFS